MGEPRGVHEGVAAQGHRPQEMQVGPFTVRKESESQGFQSLQRSPALHKPWCPLAAGFKASALHSFELIWKE